MSTLVKTNYFPSVRSLMEDFWNTDRLFNSNVKNGLPAVNVIDKKKNFLIEVAAPGFNKGDFKVDIDRGILTITAENQKSEEQKDDNYTRREFFSSSFTRAFSLPENAKESDVNAKYEDGVLKITLGKQDLEKSNKKAITVS